MDRKETVYDGDTIIDVNYRDITWESIRGKRNQALEECDWRFMSDQSPSDEWISYRRELRDLPQNHAESNDAADSFPIMPED